jgi:cytochrome c553
MIAILRSLRIRAASLRRFGSRHRMLLIALLPACAAAAGDPPGQFDLEAMLARLKQLQADPVALEAAIERGRKQAVRCAHCHGADGNSPHLIVPNMASQSVVYLIKETAAYGIGTRQDYIMTQMVQLFTGDEIVDLSLFYAAQPFQRVETGDPRLTRIGKVLYEGMCQDCHGADGRGEKGYSWIAGQRSAYVKEALKRYRKGHGKRMDEEMGKISKNLSDRNIKELAAYIANME